jgi:hypothetical protein
MEDQNNQEFIPTQEAGVLDDRGWDREGILGVYRRFVFMYTRHVQFDGSAKRSRNLPGRFLSQVTFSRTGSILLPFPDFFKTRVFHSRRPGGCQKELTEVLMIKLPF